MLAELQRSPFLDDLTPADRSVGRILLTFPIGAIAAGLAALIAGALVSVTFGLLAGGADQAEALLKMINMAVTGGPQPTSLTQILFTIALLAATNGGVVLAFVGVAAVLHHRRLRSYFTAAPRFRWRLMLLGVGLFVVTVGPLLALSALLDAKHPATAPVLTVSQTLGGRALYVVASTALLLAAAAAEELLFRGWMVKVLGAFTREPLLLIVLSGLLFSLIHLDPNLDAFLVRMAMGFGLAWMALRLGGIEFAIGAHAANNIVILLFIQPMALTPEPPHAFTPETLVVAPLMLATYVGLAELAARWEPLRRWAGVRAVAAA